MHHAGDAMHPAAHSAASLSEGADVAQGDTTPGQGELVVQGSKCAVVSLQLSWRCGVSGWYCSWAKQHPPPWVLHQHPARSGHG